jgi:hypothetical protein
MPDDPRGPELLDAVARLLRDELLPLLPPAAAFNARVAANAVDLVAREMRDGGAADAAAAARLQALLQRAAGDAGTLEAELCQRLKSGDADPDDPALRAHLWATTLDKLAIDQPGYAPYRRERQRRQE